MDKASRLKKDLNVKKLSFKDYKKLRSQLYKVAVKLINTVHEKANDKEIKYLDGAYALISQSLDEIDELGYTLDFLDRETNNYKE
jgi:hypothetical protein